MKKVWYSSGDERRFSIEVEDAVDVGQASKHLARECGRDFHTERNGSELYWPREIVLYESASSPAITSFAVDREVVVEFVAVEKRKRGLGC